MSDNGRAKIEEKIQALQLAIRSLQEDQWDCGYDDKRVQRITALRAMLTKLLGE